MKRFPYEGGHRVPGIVRFPGIISEGTVSDILFNGTDWLSTLVSLTGAEVPSDRAIDGIDAFNALLNRKVTREVSSIWFYPNHEDTYFRMPQIAMRSNHFTLIGYLPPKTDDGSLRQWMSNSVPVKFELYDIEMDPSQEEDVSDEHQEVVSEMKKEMISLWREMRDEGLSGRIALTGDH